jgi:pantothenate kinase
MERLRRIEQTTSLEERLAERAQELRAKAKALHGIEREDMMRQAREADIASHMNEWLSSPGLQTPK